MCPVNRREFCSGLATLSAGWALQGFAKQAGNQQPNMVFVLADDLGWGDLDSYNAASAVPTPNANRLASQGMRWTDMHASDAVCTPSRYSILTGRNCWRTELKKGVLNGYSPNLIELDRVTVASMLKSAGYFTAGVGKWHLGLGEQAKTNFSKPLHPGPTDHGFDYYFGIPASLDMPPYLYFENDHAVEEPTSSTPGSKDPRGVFWRPGPMAPHLISRKYCRCSPTKRWRSYTSAARIRRNHSFSILPCHHPIPRGFRWQKTKENPKLESMATTWRKWTIC